MSARSHIKRSGRCLRTTVRGVQIFLDSVAAEAVSHLQFSAVLAVVPVFSCRKRRARDGSFHVPLSIMSYRLAHLRPHSQPCMETLYFLLYIFRRAYSLSVCFSFRVFSLNCVLFEDCCCCCLSSRKKDLGQKNVVLRSLL